MFSIVEDSVFNNVTGKIVEHPALVYDCSCGTVFKTGELEFIKGWYEKAVDKYSPIDTELAGDLRLADLCNLDAKRACTVLNYALNCHGEKLVELLSLEGAEFIKRVDGLSEYYSK